MFQMAKEVTNWERDLMKCLKVSSFVEAISYTV